MEFNEKKILKKNSSKLQDEEMKQYNIKNGRINEINLVEMGKMTKKVNLKLNLKESSSKILIINETQLVDKKLSIHDKSKLNNVTLNSSNS